MSWVSKRNNYIENFGINITFWKGFTSQGPSIFLLGDKDYFRLVLLRMNSMYFSFPQSHSFSHNLLFWFEKSFQDGFHVSTELENWWPVSSFFHTKYYLKDQPRYSATCLVAGKSTRGEYLTFPSFLFVLWGQYDTISACQNFTKIKMNAYACMHLQYCQILGKG